MVYFTIGVIVGVGIAAYIDAIELGERGKGFQYS